MTPAEACELLGVDPGTDWDHVRQRYRDRIRRAHPDVSGGSTAQAAALNVAFATLVRERRNRDATGPTEPGAAAQPVAPPQTISADVALVDGHTLVVEAPPDETFARVLVALDLIGEISYVDRTGPIAEAVVVLEDGTSHSLVVSFQGRGLGTEVFATLESIETVASAPPAQVLRTLARFIPPA